MIKTCTNCDLSFTSNIVNGFGNKDSPIMIIGEAPGYHEDKTGLPFVGNSGKHLDIYLKKVGIKRSTCYLTNIIKCQPLLQRVPSMYEINACKPHLLKELKTIKPLVIVLLGRIALQVFIKGATISKQRGKVIKIKNSYIVPTYHPSYLLRNNDDGTMALRDWLIVKHIVNKLMPNYHLL